MHDGVAPRAGLIEGTAHGPSQREVTALVAAFTAGHCESSAALARELVLRFAHFGLGWNLLGASLGRLGRLLEAVEPGRMAVQVSPGDPEAHNNLGNTLALLGYLEEAEGCFRKALQLQPEHFFALNSLGAAVKQQGRLADAEAIYRQALAMQPDSADVLSNLGNLMLARLALDDAVDFYRRALRQQPNHALALRNLGVALEALGHHAQAEAAFRGALRSQPANFDAFTNLLFNLNYQEKPDARALEYAREFGRAATRQAGGGFGEWGCDQTPSRLRVGIVSGDLRAHSVAYFLGPFLSACDRNRLELFAYPTVNQQDAVTAGLKTRFDRWTPIFGRTDREAADLIHGDAVHVLMDLSGHTAFNRLTMFALRPAPVQVTWLGYFATTGIEQMDYFLADPLSLPPEQEQNFTEEVWRLPETRLCFEPPEYTVAVGESPAASTGIVTFASFSNFSKLNAQVLATWARILQAVPQSRLLIKCAQVSEASVRSRILEAFSSTGISRDRLVLEGSGPRETYLLAYQTVDIVLDAFPYSGGTTTAEALWMGVPVLTMSGERLVSRQGVCLLTHAGLADWIARDTAEYVQKAIEFSRSVDALARLRLELRSRVVASPVFDGIRFARNLETALFDMWHRHKSRLAAIHRT